ncbi:sulfide:quinone oxidoreductase [Tistlia consotensis]|uniref:Sulfide:quinone oxidoreductase n=1 Tax=Tistlia consotensis USBA 355 TaxID=560819 RepID=A0A1Y6CMN8_9PROT|nr:bifunctional protein tyrosine phosphatase family protein/NAD(P)/FAD-dependent oxidoreductase [Tistlia consotensis]SMF75588.1 sulfide:quinone oxidoreductase [Tistlia consotensis USBA 355]SNS07741.1 sulfide:quinone oxidoreductase [Tistlia consotensis]
MDPKRISPFLSVSPQILPSDLGTLAAHGFKTIVNNRPDGEGEDQPAGAEIEQAAKAVGLAYHALPVVSGKVTDADVEAFAKIMAEVRGPVFAFCRTGTRSTTLWALAEAWHLDPDTIVETAQGAGYDISGLRPRLEQRAQASATGTAAPSGKAAAPGEQRPLTIHDVVVVGAGTGGISTAASLLARRPGLDIVVVDPRDKHYYQPGWTLVGGGVFERAMTERPMASVIPKGVRWLHAAVAAFEPQRNEVVLEDGERLRYRTLVVAPGLELNWDGVEGLRESLGRNGVTSNYLFDMAPYTWQLTQSLRGGTALFTQPPMPIKCAGAPQKAMYLSCDHWRRTGRLKDIDVAFHNAGGVLLGVADYVPALMEYVKLYGIDLRFNSRLVAVDGDKQIARFANSGPDGTSETIERPFDMLHVCPPQRAPGFVRSSPLANEAGWVEVSPETLQHVRFGNIFSLGDAMSAPNAKTAAAIRKQAPTVAVNLLAVLDGEAPRAVYDGYGSCPLTVERGKIVLAEFGYGGKLLPTFPTWLIEGRKPTRLAWLLKEKALPAIYWELLLKGREWLAGPTLLPHRPQAQQSPEALSEKGSPGGSKAA